MMNWLLASTTWYFYLLILGIIFIPLAKKIFGRLFFDWGYPFAKTIAIIFLSYVMFFTGFLKVLPFERNSLFLLIAIAAIINLFLLKITKKNLSHNLSWKILFFEEILFFFSLIAWVIVRGQEPSIRGLEKFMDFGFINAILRTTHFPPLDIWLSASPTHPQGYPINYYYFGHLTGAFLIKLANIKPTLGYNLILATIFAQGITSVFSLIANIVFNYQNVILKLKKINYFLVLFFGLLGSFIVNLAGNLHTIYLFTTGYSVDNPVPFWQILSRFNPTKYWYPNATRFIPYTIHEFPSYSYVVADLHGHVFDIPFVLLTLAVLFLFFTTIITNKQNDQPTKTLISNFQPCLPPACRQAGQGRFLFPIFLGFLTAVHYMTNAFDGPIYILLSIVLFFIIYKFSINWIISSSLLIISFVMFFLPFSLKFEPFVSGIGVNCSPEFLVNIKRLGPFLFEKNNCQASSLWMLFVLWGFFWINFIIFLLIKSFKKNENDYQDNTLIDKFDNFILLLFVFGTFLILIPEFFYIKDIYPLHFRANTMFKLGYQAFIIMGIASSYTLLKIKTVRQFFTGFSYRIIYAFLFCFIAIYPFFSITSYYGYISKPVELDGSKWLSVFYPEDKEIIDYLNKNITGQPVIIEAQGDSYTDYERISAYTGLPTVAGWQVHEWLWRGSSEVVGKRIADVVNLYESSDLNLTKEIIKKYQIKYVIVSGLEKQKYKNLNEDKFKFISKLIFRSNNNKGAIYQVNQAKY